ncbi:MULTISPECIES: biotin-dependent carboxyltransferase family protein [unclassified Yoonia]|uniref:5-oxoprolinase subunit C family protein n=1 Tax=unclassified Yoonia TaxID=2629118 RepID=UPI002AFEDCD6|nr:MULTISPECIES: biotin-dependent carboxyltransferase family protein [unclassified Yoonia]
MPELTIHSIGPGVTVQDLGRPGWTAQGLSRGGVADRLALLEAAALLGGDTDFAVLEMMGAGGVFSLDAPTRIVLTGAAMQAGIDGAPVPPNTTQVLPAGVKLTIGGARRGVFGYLAFAGGIRTTPVMDSRATHLTAGLGRALDEGDRLPLGGDPAPDAPPLRLEIADRCNGGTIRMMPGPQTDLFDEATLRAFLAAEFQRSPRGNRQGVRLDHDSAKFAAQGGLSVTSDLIVPGDVQMTGDGVPFVLLAECQTIGGYPRIGSVIPADLPRVAQAAPGTALRFDMLSVEDADATAQSDAARLRDLRAACQPLIRDPHDIADLLSYQLISGVTAGRDLESD